jgi:hypothetical protein
MEMSDVTRDGISEEEKLTGHCVCREITDGGLSEHSYRTLATITQKFEAYSTSGPHGRTAPAEFLMNLNMIVTRLGYKP